MTRSINLLFFALILIACNTSQKVSTPKVPTQSVPTSASNVSNGNTQRSVQNINTDWQYLENNTESYATAMSMEEWSAMTLPHTWNQWDAVDQVPGYRRDASWYMRSLDVTPSEDQHYLVYFEGANITTTVYVNGELVGKHVGGYVGFEFDITDYLSADGDNTLAVRVDNSYNPDVIPSQKADFFIYGGITRDVWLKTLPKHYISKVAVVLIVRLLQKSPSRAQMPQYYSHPWM